MRFFLCFLFCLILSSAGLAQNVPAPDELAAHFGFDRQTLATDSYEIVYYVRSEGPAEKTNLVLYLQGTDPSPQVSYRIVADTVQVMGWMPRDFRHIPDDHLYVLIEKTGFGQTAINEDSIPKPAVYQQTNSLDHRVWQADAVLRHLTSQQAFERVIVYGHSEGAPVAAKLGTVNASITHLGFWAGNALPDFYDFALMSRIAYHEGKITDEEAHEQVMQTIRGFTEDVASDTASTAGGSYTNLRWWSYAEPPLNHLLQIDIPIFVQVATLDTSAPIESTYLIPLEFARLGKTNLSYNVCVGCDHSFQVASSSGRTETRWPAIFQDFLAWTQTD
ncbi:MAG: hypothetical protein AAGI08_17980 [Bacteroidota bacterium]